MWPVSFEFLKLREPRAASALALLSRCTRALVCTSAPIAGGGTQRIGVTQRRGGHPAQGVAPIAGGVAFGASFGAIEPGNEFLWNVQSAQMQALLPPIFRRMRVFMWAESAQRILRRVLAVKSHIALKRSGNAVGGPAVLRCVRTAKSHIALKRSGNAVENQMRVCIVSIVEVLTSESNL